MAATDLRGVVCAANARLATMLNVSPAFLVDKSLIHFVVRGDCHIFRQALGDVVGGAQQVFVVSFRPRRGSPPFAAETRAGVVEVGQSRSIVWTIRPWLEPCPARGGLETIAAVISASVESIRRAARRRGIFIVEDMPLDLPITGERASDVRRAIDHLACAALYLAHDGNTLRVSAHAGEDGSAIVTFGSVSTRIPLADRARDAAR
jgi:hypothetical protein